MKPAPEFNETEARVEVLAYIRRLTPSLSNIVYVQLNAKDKAFFEECVVNKRRYWQREWAERQIRKGGDLLDDLLRAQSKNDRELIEDYLQDRLDEARMYSREEGMEMERSYHKDD